MIPVSPPQHKAFLCVGSFTFSPLNWAALPEIWASYSSALVLERPVVCRDGCDHSSHLSAALRFAMLPSFQPVLQWASLCWGPAVGTGEETGGQRRCSSDTHMGTSCERRASEASHLPRPSPQGVLTEALQALSLPSGTRWLPGP